MSFYPFVGHWQDNLPYGEGTLYYSDGSYYVGNFFIMKCYIVILGSFLEGEKHGEGVFYDIQNDGYEENWTNGELVRRSPVSPLKQGRSSSKTGSS